MTNQSNQSAISKVESEVDVAARYGFNVETYNEDQKAAQQLTNYGKYTIVENARVVTKSWQDSSFIWSLPGQSKEFPEILDGISSVTGLGGAVIKVELMPALSVAVDESGNDKKTVCSAIGHKEKDRVTNPDNHYVRKLPGTTSLGNMYDFDNTAKRFSPTTPAAQVDILGLVGSRGQTCAECIRSGNSQSIGVDGKEYDCKVRGRMFFYLTHVYQTIKSPPNSKKPDTVVKKSIREVLRADSLEEIGDANGILLILNLPTVFGIRGIWDKDNPQNNRRGWSKFIPYLNRLAKENKLPNPNMVIPYLNYVTVNLAATKAKRAGQDAMVNYLDFDIDLEMDNASRQAVWQEAQEYWRTVVPEQEVHIIEPSYFSSKNQQAYIEPTAPTTNYISPSNNVITYGANGAVTTTATTVAASSGDEYDDIPWGDDE